MSDNATAPNAYYGDTLEPTPYTSSTEMFASGEDSPRAFLERCLSVISEREPSVRAWVVLNESSAREQADASTRRWLAGSPLSPIDGMPIGVKDLLETKDMPTQMGCEAFTGNFPKRDNAAIWALRQAGAIVLGKTVTAELGGSQAGPTTNPFDSTRSPGGSSSGSAAAVAAGMIPAAIGTQVGGSIIRPASYCGNWALKPSQGAINRGERQATSLSTHGVHAGSVADMWHTAIEIADRTGGDPGREALSGPKNPPPPRRPSVVAVMQTEGWELLDDASRQAFETAVGAIERQHVKVLRRETDPLLELFEHALVGVRDMTTTITAWETQWTMRALIERSPHGVSARSKETLAVADALGAAGYRDLLRRAEVVRSAHRNLAAVAEVSIAPSSLGPAPVMTDDAGFPHDPWPTGDPVFNTPSSLLGSPVVTVPLLSVNHLPMGLQVMGRPGSDAAVTAIARWIAQTVPRVVLS
nr:amidase [Rhodococcus sp. (in: high G+C Gram-positive bacteria)]